MNLVDLKIKDFLSQVDSASPTPGGGSVSALTIAQGISLINMTYHLSISKKKYLNSSQEIKDKYKENYEMLSKHKSLMLDSVDKDTEAFNQVMRAYKLPKDTDDDKKIRNTAINDATFAATIVPYDFAKTALDCLIIAKEMFWLTSSSTTSDFGVAILLIYSGLKGGVLNIKTNMTGLSSDYALEFIQKAESMEEDANVIFQSIYNEVLKKLS